MPKRNRSYSNNGGRVTKRRRTKSAMAIPKKSVGFLRVSRPPYNSSLPGSGPERKAFDNIINLQANTTGVQTGALNVMQQGDGAQERDGRKIFLNSVQFRGLLRTDATVALPDQVRIIVFIDNQTNGVDVGINDVIWNTGSVFKAHAPYDLSQMERFTILYDKTHAMDIGRLGGSAAEKIHFRNVKFFKKINMPVNYIGTGTTVAQIRDKSVHMQVFGVNSANGCVLEGNCRLRFTDY